MPPNPKCPSCGTAMWLIRTVTAPHPADDQHVFQVPALQGHVHDRGSHAGQRASSLTPSPAGYYAQRECRGFCVGRLRCQRCSCSCRTGV
jgi:hypothetical protein